MSEAGAAPSGRLARAFVFAKARLASARIALWASLCAVVLVLPALGGGMAFDDYFQRMRARGEDPFGRGRFDLFDFCWDARDIALGKRLGIYPWFMEPGTHIAFSRPLASLTHVVDYTLWPDHPWVMHAESIAFYAVAVFAVARLYARLVSARWVAGLAAMLYALDDAHAGPVAFLANRNAVLALAFGMGALVLHDRHRRDGFRPGAWLSAALLVAALLSAEASLGAVAYFVAYALTIERGSLGRRALSIAPHLGIVGTWQLVYRALDFGVQGSGLYLDPFREPGHYLAHAPKRALALLMSALGAPPADVWNLTSETATLGLVAAAVIVVGATAWVILPLVRRDPVARFFLVGTVLALAPVCATFPSDRLLFFIGVGVFGLVAKIVEALADGAERSRAWRVPAKALTGYWLVVLVLLAPFGKLAAATTTHLGDDIVRSSTAGLSAPADPASTHLVVVTSPNFLVNAYRWSLPRDRGDWQPGHLEVLALSLNAVELRTVDAHTITLRPRGWFLAELSCGLFRTDSHPLARGEVFELGDATATVTELDALGRATVVEFRFHAPLDDPGFRWVAWDGARFRDIALPAVGETVTLGADLPAFLVPAEAP